MKEVLSGFVLRVTLLFTAFAIVSIATSSAQSAGRRHRLVMLPPSIAMEERVTPPELNLDSCLSLLDGSVLAQPGRNPDGSITLLNGTVIPRPVHHANDTVTF